MRFLKRDADGFAKSLLVMALPMVLQNLIDASVTLADTVMLSFVSQQALSATSLANNVHNVTYMILYGLCSGSSILISQYWGRKDTETIERTIGISLRFSLSLGCIVMLLVTLIPDRIMRIFTYDTELIEIGATYLRILGAYYLMNAFTQVYTTSQRAMERVLFGTVVNTITLLTNVGLNACFIFGIGLPKLGVVGVAYATVIAKGIAFLICIADAAAARNGVRVRIRFLFARKKALFRDYMKYTLPALANDALWITGISMYSVILGHLSSDMVAANSFANVARTMATVICFAVANAAAVMMGKTLGEGNLEKGRAYAKRFMILSIFLGVLGGLAIAAAMPFLLKYARLSGEALDFLRFMLYASMINVVGQSVNTTLLCGILRAGGDAQYGLILDVISTWGYGVCIGSLLAFVLKVPPKVVYMFLFLDEILKMPVNFWRYSQGKWVKNITRDMAALD
ncbi:MAG: MATE family efflux transporter [Christensenellales bacterium]